MDVHPGSTPIIQWLIHCGSGFFGDVGIFWTSASLLQSRMWPSSAPCVSTNNRPSRSRLRAVEHQGGFACRITVETQSVMDLVSGCWVHSVEPPMSKLFAIFWIHPMFGSGHFLGAKWNESKSHSGPLKACRKHEKHLTSLDGQSSHDLMLGTAALRSTLMLAPARNATALMGSGRWFARCPPKMIPSTRCPCKAKRQHVEGLGYL